MSYIQTKLKIVLHAPDILSVQRARSNFLNLQSNLDYIEIKIIINSSAVEYVLDNADNLADKYTWVCPNTLAKLQRTAPSPLAVLEQGAVISLALLQQQGWQYIHC